MQNKANFRKSQVDVNLYNTTDYEEKSNWTFGENKPNSNPIKANFLKPKMNLKLLATKGYENKTALGLEQNKPKQSQCFFLPILPMPRKLTQEPPFSKKPGNGSPRKNQPSPPLRQGRGQPKKCRNF